MLEPVRYFLTHPFGLSVMAWAAVAAGLLAAWLSGRQASWPRKRVVLAAAAPTPLVFVLVTAALFLIAPWDDPLINAALLTVGMLGAIFSLLIGLLVAWLATAGSRR